MDINSSTISFRITLTDLEYLKPHEEIIEQAVTELATAIQVQNEVRDPLMVDKKSMVILDGMHRFNALRKLSCQRAPVCLVDYDDVRLSVGSWYRCFNAAQPDALAAEALEAVDRKFERVARVSQSDLTNAVIITSTSEFHITEEMERLSKAQLAVRIEKSISARGFKCEYAADDTITQPNSKANLVIPVPIFTKAEIRQTAESGRLLPHKVTRHVIPSRPLRLDVPLNLLTAFTSEEANEKLEQLLSSRHVNMKPPGSVVDGRRYEEELLVFEG